SGVGGRTRTRTTVRTNNSKSFLRTNCRQFLPLAGDCFQLGSGMLQPMRNNKLSFWIAVGTAVMLIAASLTAQNRAATPTSVRLYIFDCGTIGSMNPASYDLKAEEIKGSLDFITPCYLVVHPRGTLMWDVGQIPDANFPADGSTAKQGVFTS